MSRGDIDIVAAEKKAGQKARRKLRRQIRKNMFNMVSVGQTKGAPKEESLSSTTVKLMMETGGMDALVIDIPRHGLILQHAVAKEDRAGRMMNRKAYPFVLDALYETKIIEDLGDDIAGLRGDYVSQLVRGLPNKV